MSAVKARDLTVEEIAASRSDAWDFVNSRKHTLLGVYTRTQDFSDIVVLGGLQMEFKNGAKVDSEFSAQIIFDIDGSGSVKAKSWKIFAVSDWFRTDDHGTLANVRIGHCALYKGDDACLIISIFQR